MSTFASTDRLILTSLLIGLIATPTFAAEQVAHQPETLVLSRPSHLPVSKRRIEQVESAITYLHGQSAGPKDLDPLANKKEEYKNLYLEAQFDTVIHGISALEKRILTDTTSCFDEHIFKGLADLKMLEAMARYKSNDHDPLIDTALHQVVIYDTQFEPEPTWHSPSIINRLNDLQKPHVEHRLTVHIDTLPSTHDLYLNGRFLGPAQQTVEFERTGEYRVEARAHDHICRAETIKNEKTGLEKERHVVLSVPAYSEAEKEKTRRAFDFRLDRKAFLGDTPDLGRSLELIMITTDRKEELKYLMAHQLQKTDETASLEHYSRVVEMNVPEHPPLEQVAEAISNARARIASKDVQEERALEDLFWGRHLPRAQSEEPGQGVSKGLVVTGVIVGLAAVSAAVIYFTRQPNDHTTIVFDGTGLGGSE